MSESGPSEMLIVSSAGLDRYKYAAYPIFTLHKSDTALIKEYRDIIAKLNIACEELDLPGATEPEVGFVMAYMDMLMINSYLFENCNGSAIDKALDVWMQTPFSTILPEGVSIPDVCFMPIHELLKKRANAEDEEDKRETTILLNVPTGEKVRITVDFVKKTYSFSGDITGWKHVTILPDIDSPRK